MKLWEKKAIPDPSVIEFTSGRDRTTDLCLAEWDIAGSMAHSIMLNETGLISAGESKKLLEALYSIFQRAKGGKLIIEEGIEDIHISRSQIRPRIQPEHFLSVPHPLPGGRLRSDRQDRKTARC